MTTTHDDKAREREQFEQAAKSNCNLARHPVFPEHYDSIATQFAWNGWQWRAALSPASTGQGAVAELGKGTVTLFTKLTPYGKSLPPGKYTLFAAPAQQVEAEKIDDRKIADTVNELRDIAIQFHGAQQLRERIAHVIVPLLKSAAGSNNGETK